ncbi:MAG: PorV/PorQ family protein [candidate division Zixibacteria bacterium]|nr:PorV/PorQ family protein [candidate division Zixibacteria bacterium]NIU14184.1 PorV/PorQ family protein [candidate division Zixibacteria bacterium]NIX58393.1 PorV/PorQ family protein [candidate division Zixibacteria bacterium]
MGDAYISVVEGAEATYYNPAALARVQGLDFAVTHTEWFAGINHEFAAGAYTIGNLGTIGLSVTALYTDEMKVRTPLQPDGTGETFFSSNYRAGFTFSRYLTDKVTFGGTINYIFLDLFTDFTASAVAGDIAVLYTTNFRDFKFGMRFSNFGSEIKFVNESYPLPTNFTFGLSMNAIESPEQTLMVSISAIKLNDEEPLGQVGAEWNWNQIIYLRGGYQLNHEVAKYSFGGGLKMNVSNYGLGFDYSLSDFELLGFTHRFGLSIDL